MKLHELSGIGYLRESAVELNLKYEIIVGQEARDYMHMAEKNYNIELGSVRPNIPNSKVISREDNEKIFSEYMEENPAYFFCFKDIILIGI